LRIKKKIIADINITPFTDVVLVLLIIFMIATPFLYQSSLNVDLPRGGNRTNETLRDVMITVNSEGDIFLEDAKIDPDTLRNKVLELMADRPQVSIVINGDKNAKYDAVLQVMLILTQAGVNNINLGVEPVQ
jgi:biopolymer transport protein ExbD